VRWVTQDRVGPPGITLSSLSDFEHKLITLPIITLPLLPGLALALRDDLRRRGGAALTLALAGAASAGLFLVFFIAQGGPNEYKWIYAMALALAPAAALGMSGAIARLGARWLPVTLAGLLVLSAPGFHRWVLEGPDRRRAQSVPVLSDHFALRLGADHRYQGPPTRSAARRRPRRSWSRPTPASTCRPWCSARVKRPYGNHWYPGHLAVDKFLLEVEGYPQSWLTERRADLHALLDSTGATTRAGPGDGSRGWDVRWR